MWPLSNDVRSKQFLKIFTRKDGIRESMAQRMYRMIKEIDPDSIITIATSESQISQIREQLGENVGISVEPIRRDTFPAIALAAAYLKKQGVKMNASVIVCPVDPYVNEDYFECLKILSDAAEREDGANVTLMGIEPTYSSEKYGYIIPKNKDRIAFVKEFKEKPTTEMAEKYIKQGALWNGGVFAFKLSYILNIAKSLLGTDNYQTLYDNYESFQKISFDYAVVEKEKSIKVVRFNGQWKDLGTWNTLSEAMEEPISGNVTVDDCDNTHVINELSIPLIALGIKDAVIAATPDGILVTNKEKSPRLKDYVLSARPMYERKEWGEYKVLDYKVHSDSQNSLTRELLIFPGQQISYQRHKHRTEIWTIIEGVGELVLDDNTKIVSRGDVEIINIGVKHGLKSFTELHIIEVQIGDDLTEEDIERLD